MIRAPLLEHDPELGAIDLHMLVGIAGAVEREAVERYVTLADIMERRGEPELAAAFRAILDEERCHAEAVQHWAAGLGQRVPDAAEFRWRLPADLSKSWDEVAASGRLTPYRAFAIAADNEQRAFALYSYIAASAGDPTVAAQAEALAKEELRHAALMRRWRREAWHRERRHATAEPAVRSSRELHELLARREAAIGGFHRAIAERLRALGDAGSAQAVEKAASRPSWQPAAAAEPPEPLPEGDNPVRLLLAAQAPLEALSDTLEAVMRENEGEVFEEAERAAGNVIGRIAEISLQAERRMHAPGG